MAGEWRASTWGEEISLEYGKALRGYDDARDEYRVYGTNGPVGWTAQPLAPGPGVVLGRKGAYRGVQYSADPFFVIDTAYYVVPKTSSDMRWIYYAIKHYKLGEVNDGSPIPSTTRTAVYMMDIDVPPILEQRAIAHILGTLDDKVELNQRMIETLEAMARAIFKSWFLDFEPVRAKVEGRWLRGESLPGLAPDLYDLFPDRLVDSELGEIPEGWATGRFGAVAEHLREQEKPLSSPDTLFSHYSIPAFDEGKDPRLEYGTTIKSLKLRVPTGSVLLSKLNPEIERAWLVDVQPGERAVCSTEFLVLRSRPPFTRSYVYCLARSALFRQQVEGLVTGTSKSHQRAPVESVLDLAVVLPPSELVAVFEQLADGWLARTLDCRRQSRTLVSIRDALLPNLVSGELRVGDAERFLEAAV